MMRIAAVHLPLVTYMYGPPQLLSVLQHVSPRDSLGRSDEVLCNPLTLTPHFCGNVYVNLKNLRKIIYMAHYESDKDISLDMSNTSNLTSAKTNLGVRQDSISVYSDTLLLSVQ